MPSEKQPTSSASRSFDPTPPSVKDPAEGFDADDTPTTPVAPSRSSAKRRKYESDSDFALRQARRNKPFQQLSISEMLDEIHDKTADMDSNVEDDAWSNQDTRIEYLLLKFGDVLKSRGII